MLFSLCLVPPYWRIQFPPAASLSSASFPGLSEVASSSGAGSGLLGIGCSAGAGSGLLGIGCTAGVGVMVVVPCWVVWLEVPTRGAEESAAGFADFSGNPGKEKKCRERCMVVSQQLLRLNKKMKT